MDFSALLFPDATRGPSAMMTRRTATMIYAVGLVVAALPWYMHGAMRVALVVSLVALALLLEMPFAPAAETACCLLSLAALTLDALRYPFIGSIPALAGLRLVGLLYALPIWCAAGCMLRAALYDQDGINHEGHEENQTPS